MVTQVKQDVIIIGAIIKSPKRSVALSGIGLTFTRNAYGWGSWRHWGPSCMRGMETPNNTMTKIPLHVP